MSSLRDTQLAFARRVFGPGRAVSPREQIYRNNVFISLTGALADVYPVVRRLVGERYFAQLARRYVRIHPSRSGNLHDFGRQMSRFLGELHDLKNLPYLPDIAALEWACHGAFHAGEAAPLDFARLADVENAKAALHPAVRLVASRYPVLAIWEANQADDPGVIDLDAGIDWLVVFRRDLEVQILSASAGEFALLAALHDDRSLGEACATALAAEPALDLAATMRRLAINNLLTKGVMQ
jgi:hypothetical protein